MAKVNGGVDSDTALEFDTGLSQLLRDNRYKIVLDLHGGISFLRRQMF